MGFLQLEKAAIQKQKPLLEVQIDIDQLKLFIN
jgi:hypothetical protein